MTTTFTAEDICARLNSLPAAHTDADKVQLALVQALLARSSGKSDAARHSILAKAWAVLEHYASHSERQQENHCEHQQQTSLQTDPARPATATGGLATLVELLGRDTRHLDTETATASLDDLLQRMEQDIIRPAAPYPIPTAEAIPAKKSRSRKKTAPAVPAGQELKAVRLARKNMALERARELVDDMNSRQPENPGPLNPQMLATRAITQMRDLSPAYLNRFLTMMDTLLWLPKN